MALRTPQLALLLRAARRASRLQLSLSDNITLDAAALDMGATPGAALSCSLIKLQVGRRPAWLLTAHLLPPVLPYRPPSSGRRPADTPRVLSSGPGRWMATTSITWACCWGACRPSK